VPKEKRPLENTSKSFKGILEKVQSLAAGAPVAFPKRLPEKEVPNEQTDWKILGKEGEKNSMENKGDRRLPSQKRMIKKKGFHFRELTATGRGCFLGRKTSYKK